MQEAGRARVLGLHRPLVLPIPCTIVHHTSLVSPTHPTTGALNQCIHVLCAPMPSLQPAVPKLHTLHGLCTPTSRGSMCRFKYSSDTTETLPRPPPMQDGLRSGHRATVNLASHPRQDLRSLWATETHTPTNSNDITTESRVNPQGVPLGLGMHIDSRITA